jgi:hypothetical protein
MMILVAGCATAPHVAPGIGNQRFGETFTTEEGRPQSVADEVLVTFVRVIEDSRCPKQVTCIWQGAAKIRLTLAIKVHGEQQPMRALEISTAPESAASAIHEGYRIELLGVSPYPDAAIRRESLDYTADLRVSRAR